MGSNVPVGVEPRHVVVDDFNADGFLDVVVANRAGGSVTLLAGDGLGGLRRVADFPVAVGPRAIATGDFNGDGLRDLATANIDGHSVTLLVGDGAGRFFSAGTIGVDERPRWIASSRTPRRPPPHL